MKVNLLIHTTCFTVETFQGPIQLQVLVPLTVSLAFWNNQRDWISVIQGSLLRLRTAWGSGLALVASGVQICWEADGCLVGDHPILSQNESKEARLQLVCVPPEQETVAPLSPRAEWVLSTSYFTESQFSENVLTVSKWHFYVA